MQACFIQLVRFVKNYNAHGRQKFRHARFANRQVGEKEVMINDDDICREIGADHLIYQELDSLKEDVRRANPLITRFETSCFDGNYITGDVTPEYLAMIEAQRNAGLALARAESSTQLDLNLVTAD